MANTQQGDTKMNATDTIKKYADNALAIQWSNDPNAEVDEVTGDVWYNGHWATDDELDAFAEWINNQ